MLHSAWPPLLLINHPQLKEDKEERKSIIKNQHFIYTPLGLASHVWLCHVRTSINVGNSD